MQKIFLGAALALLTFTSATSMAQYSRTEQQRVERRMANMESISVRKSLDGLLRGDYVEQLFIDATRLNAGSAYMDIIIDDRVVKTIALDRNLLRYSFRINMRNGEDYTRILIRARGSSVYLASFGVVINDRDEGYYPPPPPPIEPPRPPRPPVRPPAPPRPPSNPFTQGEFCNGTTIVHWECGRGASGAVPQGDGCYHTDTGRYCGGSRPPVPPPSNPFTQGEFCNGSTIVHWECGDGARGAVPQPGGCYHTDTGRGCR